MNFKFHPPTRSFCEVCEKLDNSRKPLISTHKGRASSANNFPFHRWFNFTLGYSPEFPDYILKREKAEGDWKILDPFLGSGTTSLACRSSGISSIGIEANDYFAFAANVKLNWNLDVEKLKSLERNLRKRISSKARKFDWNNAHDQLAEDRFKGNGSRDVIEFADLNRPEMLTKRYISDLPFAKLQIIKDCIEKFDFQGREYQDFFLLAFSAIIRPVSNVTYGPGFGVKKPKGDVNVFETFFNKVENMIDDLTNASSKLKKVSSDVILGDSRQMSQLINQESIDLMITSPPYPGDHEYTKHSRLELIMMEFANDLSEFREIKKRMVRGSTTNTYKDDNEGDEVREIKSIQKITNQIDERLKEDNATSGFEKLYVKLVWEYFGGMYNVFKESHKCLKPGGKFALLVSDSHAFKMVHIQTAEILAEVAQVAGFSKSHIELWQAKNTTSHKYKLFEEILTLTR